jgi:hypothetical protein
MFLSSSLLEKRDILNALWRVRVSMTGQSGQFRDATGLKVTPTCLLEDHSAITYDCDLASFKDVTAAQAANADWRFTD